MGFFSTFSKENTFATKFPMTSPEELVSLWPLLVALPRGKHFTLCRTEEHCDIHTYAMTSIHLSIYFKTVN